MPTTTGENWDRVQGMLFDNTRTYYMQRSTWCYIIYTQQIHRLCLVRLSELSLFVKGFQVYCFQTEHIDITLLLIFFKLIEPIVIKSYYRGFSSNTQLCFFQLMSNFSHLKYFKYKVFQCLFPAFNYHSIACWMTERKTLIKVDRVRSCHVTSLCFAMMVRVSYNNFNSMHAGRKSSIVSRK